MKLLIHHVPASTAQGSAVSLSKINSPDFDFAKDFVKEAFAKLGRFFICYKAKPWMPRDLMIIDSADDYAKSITDLKSNDFDDLAKIVKISVEELKSDPDVAKIVVGANINSIIEKEDHESVFRLHVHVCGLTQQELDEMEPLEEELPIFRDEIISQFKSAFGKEDNVETYVYGIKKDLTGLDYAELISAIKILAEKSQKVLNDLSRDFSVVSYSFALSFDGDAINLYISPKSSDGRGVLEALGIVLNRDGEILADENFIKNRNRFLNKVKLDLISEANAQEGKLNLEVK